MFLSFPMSLKIALDATGSAKVDCSRTRPPTRILRVHVVVIRDGRIRTT